MRIELAGSLIFITEDFFVMGHTKETSGASPKLNRRDLIAAF
jgi:hypothetical protein